MGKKSRDPVTAAIRVLRAAKAAYTTHSMDYVAHGGTGHTATVLEIEEHRVIKTLIFETETGDPLVILMHGDRSVSAKGLARTLGVKATRPCDPAVAQRHSGYQVGGTSPFGVRRSMPVYVEASILALDRLIINGGKRGFLLEMTPQVLIDVLQPQPVDVAVP